MSGDNKHEVRNGIIITVVGGLILSLVVSLIPGLAQWLYTVLMLLPSYLASTTAIPIWTLIALILLALLSLYILTAKVTSRIPSANRPAHTKYTHDEFFGAIWRWSWSHNTSEPSFITVTGFCRNCDTRLVYEYDVLDNSTTLYCETCQKKQGTLPQTRDMPDIRSMVIRQIDRKVRNGEWKHVVTYNSPQIDRRKR